VTAINEGLPTSFWKKVVAEPHGYETPCLVWTGSRVANGYGQLTFARKRYLAHRFAFTRLIGPIPDKHDLDHLCRVRACVNVEHLQPVTRQENLLRGYTITAANAAKTHCPQGHEYTPDNLIRDKRGRKCRTCNRERMRIRNARKRMEKCA
jgi:hypothetical protein